MTKPTQRIEPEVRDHSAASLAATAETAAAKPSPKSAGPRQQRRGEAIRVWYRSERVFFQNGHWYISTREGIDVGPYSTAAEARKDEKQLLQLLLESASFGPQGQALTIHQFMNRPRLRNRR